MQTFRDNIFELLRIEGKPSGTPSDLQICQDFGTYIKPADLHQNNIRALYLSLVIISILTLGIVILTLVNNGNLAHPAKLIFFICVFEAIYCYSAFIQANEVTIGYFVCYFKIDKLLLLSTGKEITEESR